MPHNGEALVAAKWPQYDTALEFSSEETEFEKIMAVIRAVRNRRAEMNVPASKKTNVQIASSSADTFKAGEAYICRLAFASAVEVGDSFNAEGAVRVVTDAATVYIPMKELVDAEKELARLNKELEAANKAIGLMGGSFERMENYDLSDTDLNHNVVIIKKISHTPTKYPRSAPKPAKEPLY